MFGWLKKSPVSHGPDFSNIDSQQKAIECLQRGQLEKLLLMPSHFGGDDTPQNTVYVPLGIAAVKADIDANIVGPLVAERKVTTYKASPEYQGKSFVPIAIKIVASDPGSFSTVINIWGKALERNSK